MNDNSYGETMTSSYIWRFVPFIMQEGDWMDSEWMPSTYSCASRLSSMIESNMIKMKSMWRTRCDLYGVHWRISKVVMLRLMGWAMMDQDLERMIKEKNSTYGLKIGSWWAHMLSHGWLCLEASNSSEEFIVPLKRLCWSMKKSKWWPIWYSWRNLIWS